MGSEAGTDVFPVREERASETLSLALAQQVVPGGPQGKAGPKWQWAAPTGGPGSTPSSPVLAGARTSYCQSSLPQSTCFACSPKEGIPDFQPFALSEGPRPSHHPLPRSKVRAALIPGPQPDFAGLSPSPNLKSLGPQPGSYLGTWHESSGPASLGQLLQKMTNTR